MGQAAERAILACAVALSLAAPARAADAPARVRSTAAQRDEVALTVYNQDFALVRERRTLDLGSGNVALEFGEVAATIQPETVLIKSLAGGDALGVLEQNYQYDLLSPEKLLEKYVGRAVKVYRWNERLGRDEEFPAEVLATSGRPILKLGDEITFDFPGRVSFPEIPKNLIAKPTLAWSLVSKKPRQQLEVSYLANQINWKADYVLAVNEKDTAGDLTGWVTLDNRSGASYEKARLQLVAGDVQRLGKAVRADVAYETMARAQAPQFQERAFFEYHLYTLERPASVLDREQKQLSLLEAAGVALTKRLVLRGEEHYYRSQYGEFAPNQKVGVFLEFENRAQNRLGVPLPRGVVRVYKADTDGGRQFIGEDEIDHTPRDERVRIKVGEAFDVVADRRQMEWKAISACTSESAWRIELRNHKDEAVEIDVVEPASGDWEILQSSHPQTREDAHTFRFRVKVPARGAETITYRARVRWC
jgi:hypothetical protein